VITQDQTEVLDFLTARSTHAGAAVERIDTHASVVVLAGEHAWKLKRAVRYDYLDFSTPDRRRAMCEAELRLNRRTAPTLYRRVVAVTREADGKLTLGGSGAPVDWLVEMARFDQEGLFDRLAARGALDLALMAPLATAVGRFHAAAESCPEHGGKRGMAWVIDGNAGGFAEEGRDVLDGAAASRLTAKSRVALDEVGGPLERRRREGRVRRCHGDLHLRNVVLLDGQPTLFDGVEFNDEIACIDVWYDLAFLLMDLWRRELPRHANVVLNAYISETGDLDGLRLLPLFLSCRAAVRAKTSATAARLQSLPARRAELEATAAEYLRRAEELLTPPAPCLIAIGGFSGSGKSTLAQALAPSVGPVPGAVLVRSDEVRKRMFGVAPLVRLGPEGHEPEVSRRVYDTLADSAAAVIRLGHTVIVDAVFARPADRDALEQVAARASVPFAGLWLEAPESTLIARAERRGLDPSDADAHVIRAQLTHGTGTIRWSRIPATGTADVVRDQACNAVRTRCESAPCGIPRPSQEMSAPGPPPDDGLKRLALQ
jgi:aminoglycoside phosphotransferase family enzyme/predicted kinase